MPIETISFYTRQLLRANPKKFFVFGDNLARKGYGGQAAHCRGEPNAIGVITKKYPSNLYESYFYEIEFDSWKELASADLSLIQKRLIVGETIVWPKDGIGTGLAKLPEKAPSIDKFLKEFLAKMKEIYG